MEAWQTLDATIGRGEPKTLADRLHVSRTTINNWCIAPPRDGGEGQYSPLERVAQMVEILRELENEKSEDLVQWLLSRLGYLPGVRVEALGKPTFAHLGDFLRETGELVTKVSEATRDQILTDDELTQVIKEGEDAFRALHSWLTDMKVSQATARAEAARTTFEEKPIKNFVSVSR